MIAPFTQRFSSHPGSPQSPLIIFLLPASLLCNVCWSPCAFEAMVPFLGRPTLCLSKKYRLNSVSHKFICWKHKPQYHRMWRYGLYRGNQVKVRTLWWALIQYKCCPYRRGNMDPEIRTRGKCHVEPKAETGWCISTANNAKDLQQTSRSWERGIEQTLPESLEATDPTNTQILDFQPTP